MSSFDALDASGGDDSGSRGFEPLCPSQQTGEPTDANWRPLFRDAGLGGAFAAGGQQLQDDGSSPKSKDESGVSRGGAEPASEECTRAFAEGYELGRQETRADLDMTAEALVSSVKELSAFRARLRQRYEQEVLELALGIARKVVHAELRERPESWLPLIREAIRGALDREEVCIRLPPVLAAFFTEHLPEIRAQLDEVKDLVILEDPSLKEGGCVIETRFGEIDVGINTQIDQIERELRRVG